MRFAVFLIHGDAGRCQLAKFGAFAAADALFFHDIHGAVLIYAHCLVLLGACFVAGMIFAVLANIDLMYQGAELAKLQLNAAVTGACHPIVNEGAEQLTA